MEREIHAHLQRTAPRESLPHPTPTDARALRRCLGQFATGVTVVTAQADGELAGLTVNSFTSVSLDPPLILWCLGRHSRSLRVFRAASHFAVNVLAAGEEHIAQRFATPGEEKFAGPGWGYGRGETPIIHGGAATLVCQPESFQEVGDHVVVIGRVVHFEHRNVPLLVFAQGRFSSVRSCDTAEPVAMA